MASLDGGATCAFLQPHHFNPTIGVCPSESPTPFSALELIVQFVSDPIWKDYGVKAPLATPSRYDLPMEQPFFPVRSVDVKTTVKPGRTMVFVGGGLSQKESGNKTLLVFVTVNGVSADIQ